MPNLVVHDAALAAKREALAAAQSAAMVRPAGGYGATALSKPDPNAPAQRAERVRRLQFMVREREEERRRQRGEKVKPFSRKKNYYDRLGLPRDCSAAEVRRAFRRLSLLFHPDKQLGKSDEEVAAASVLFRELCEVRREAAALRQPSCRDTAALRQRSWDEAAVSWTCPRGCARIVTTGARVLGGRADAARVRPDARRQGVSRASGTLPRPFRDASVTLGVGAPPSEGRAARRSRGGLPRRAAAAPPRASRLHRGARCGEISGDVGRSREMWGGGDPA